MNRDLIYNFKNHGGVSDIYTISTSFGVYDGYDCVTEKTDSGFKAERDGFRIESLLEEAEGVSVRTDVLKNIADKKMTLYNYAYRFCIDAREVEVYTQLSNWQNESDGKWQELTSGVTSMSKGVYTTADATPIVAVWNKQTHRGTVFHIMPRHGWKIDVNKRCAVSGEIYTIVEISICDDALRIELDQGEEMTFSPVIYYEFRDKLTLDSHKLHQYMNKKYPRKSLPVMYNTWLATFDRISYEVLSKQAEEASKLGCEYFVIDAGWFGKGDELWADLIGLWEENQTGGLKGRMIDVSEKVHSLGMKFGMWIEPERALERADAVKIHPEYYFTNGTSYFLDYSLPEAREFMKKTVCSLIDRYSVDYVKLDFNDCVTYDIKGRAFYDYHKGYFEFISSLREKYPDLYIEGCAGGGYRLDLDAVRLFDSYWFTDNQSAHGGSIILKNSILRMPPSFLDRWISVTSVDGCTPTYETRDTKRAISTNNGTWDEIVGVHPEFLTAFFAGGCIGLSCDLTKWDEDLKKHVSEFIKEHKKERKFWMSTTCRIICDTERVVALQYENNGKIKVVIYTYNLKQPGLRIYPVIENRSYKVDGVERSYADIDENGIYIEKVKNYHGYIIDME